MIRVLTRRDAIREAEQRLRRLFREAADRQGVITMGHRGGPTREDAYYISDIDLWAAFRNMENRYWNAFGQGDPLSDQQQVPITAQINPPHEAIDRTTGGIFGVDAEERNHLLHRGNIGGGQPGVGKTNFLRYLRGRWPLTRVEDGERESDVIEITCLETEHTLAHITSFVALVDEFKTDLSERHWSPTESEEATDDHEYRPEFQGTRRVPERDALTQQCDHGVVVHRLVEELRATGLPAANDQPRDVYVPAQESQAEWLFEAKTGTDPQSVYTALGQLVFHAPDTALRVAVLPDQTPRRLLDRVQERGMEVLRYRWKGDRPIFPALETLVERGGPQGPGG